jgi:hypothetical protein
MRIASLICLFVVLSPTSERLLAQTFIQIETYGKIKPLRFHPGDEIEFMHDKLPEVWMKRTLMKVDADNQLLYFPDAIVPVASIYKIRIDNPSFWRQFALVFFKSAAVTTFLGSGWAWAFQGVPPNWIAIAIMVAPFTIGNLIKKWTRYKTFHIGKRHRLRALDLNFGEIAP